MGSIVNQIKRKSLKNFSKTIDYPFLLRPTRFVSCGCCFREQASTQISLLMHILGTSLRHDIMYGNFHTTRSAIRNVNRRLNCALNQNGEKTGDKSAHNSCLYFSDHLNFYLCCRLSQSNRNTLRTSRTLRFVTYINKPVTSLLKSRVFII